MNLYRSIIRPLLFLIPAEAAHHLTMHLLKLTLSIPLVRPLFLFLFRNREPKLNKKVFSISFPNPVGLAAGFDKNAAYIDELAALGFGFIEIGTVTPLPQLGNPRPRLFRLKEDQALINRMGFNNEGVEVIAQRLKKVRSHVVIGGNIGKNKITPNDKAADDYEICFEKLFPHVDYFVVNLSSPNTPGLRDLQEREPLKKLLAHLQKLNAQKEKRKPILLKIAPDLTSEQLDDIIEIAEETGIDGIIATNTTIERDGLQSENKNQRGGLSGKPLEKRSNEVISYLKERVNVPVIGSGGIFTAEDAYTKIKAGADLVQIYTGFIYSGPGLIKKINRRLMQNN